MGIFEAAARLLTVKQLAARWSVSTATVYWLVESGALRSLRVGGSLRFRAVDVSDYERSREQAEPVRRVRRDREK